MEYVRSWLQKVPGDAPVCSFPPFYGGGYEKLYEPYEPVLDAAETSRAAYKIGNSATALGVILAVFERHLSELAEGWFDAASGEPVRAGTAPLETVFGVRDVPVATAAVVRAAIDRMVQDGTVPEDAPWRALDVRAGATP
ncbi:hypothetical protein ACFV94_02915 [Streptomyces sp. NPDC059896]|uniref:putative antirestriction adenine methyltransferase n=1 Tax=Streptomyces sp. NPDC059896 TaxID=3346993 RepID=UPI00365F8869